MAKKEIEIKIDKEARKKAFTLIELLAVIIILGVLMIIAIPSVTKYIEDSRKNGYVSTAKELAGAARTLIHSGNLNLNDKDTTYYIDSECIETSNGTKTPYGELRKAYVVVNYSDDGYDYYWISVDETGTGVKKITNVEVLNTDSIENNITEADIINNLGVDARHNYVVINKENGCSVGSSTEASERVDTEGNVDIINYPAGKNKRTLEVGDIIKFGNEEFFFLKYDGNDAILMARYNLKVGSIARKSDHNITKTYSSSDSGYGLRSSECIGLDEDLDEFKCVLDFSNGKYWDNQLGEGKLYPDPDDIYDSNSNLYPYIDNYVNYLEGLGANIKKARLVRFSDLSSLTSKHIPTIICTSSYWSGMSEECNNSAGCVIIFLTHNKNGMFSTNVSYALGVRPIIVI